MKTKLYPHVTTLDRLILANYLKELRAFIRTSKDPEATVWQKARLTVAKNMAKSLRR